MGSVTKDDLQRFMIRLGSGRQSKDYLSVAGRLWWFRQEHSDWGIVTNPVDINTEKQYAIFASSVFNADGKLMATGTKMETARGFADYIEKAETGSVGRALILCGYGVDSVGSDLDEGERYADAPQPAQPAAILAPPTPQTAPPTVAEAMTAFGSVAKRAGFNLLNPEGKPSKAKFAGLLSDVALWAEWTLPDARADSPEAWQRGATLLPKFAAARKEAKEAVSPNG